MAQPTGPLTTFGLALDKDGGLWQYRGSQGAVKIGEVTLVEPEPEYQTPELIEDESEEDYMVRCVTEVMNQGADEPTATALCEQAYAAAQEPC